MRSVRVRQRKWPDSPHWELDADTLGDDEHGRWLGVRRGAVMQRPGRTAEVVADHVMLVPRDDWWCATFYGVDDERPFDVYVDVATPATWTDGEEETTLGLVDLDLDVVREVDGAVYIDDEDEFAEHRETLGYPADVVDATRATADRLLAQVRDAVPPFDARTPAGWIDRFREQVRA